MQNRFLLFTCFLAISFAVLLLQYKSQSSLFSLPKKRPLELLKSFAYNTQPWLQNLEVNTFKIQNNNNHTSKPRTIRFAHLSDLHYDYFHNQNFAPHVMDQILNVIQNAKLDYIFVTGDFVHHEFHRSAKELGFKFLKKLAQILADDHLEDTAAFQSRQRLFGVLGNHDLFAGDKRGIVHALESNGGIKILDNEIHVVPEDGLVLVGFSDYKDDPIVTTRIRQQLQQIGSLLETDYYVVGLSHNPDSAECTLLKHKPSYHTQQTCNGIPIKLQLSGHTHGAQIQIPLVKIPIIPWLQRAFPTLYEYILQSLHMENVVDHWEWSDGLYQLRNGNQHKLPPTAASASPTSNYLSKTKEVIMQKNETYLYISKGVGGHFGLRLFCHPEVALFDLESKN